jgi:nitrate/nitrite transport system substrate-binding protein
MLRWGQIEKPIDLRAAASAVYRTDLHREAARALGLPSPVSDEQVEGPFFDGQRFDPRAPLAHLRAQSIHARRVDLDELEAAQPIVRN